jgi:hypothetical protein
LCWLLLPFPFLPQEDEMSRGLRQEFAAFHRFLTVRFFGAQMEPISDVTARKYADHIRCGQGGS